MYGSHNLSKEKTNIKEIGRIHEHTWISMKTTISISIKKNDCQIKRNIIRKILTVFCHLGEIPNVRCVKL